MKRHRVADSWQQARLEIQQQWSKLTNEHLEMVSGKREQLVDALQECYSVTRDDAERQVRAWEARTRICLFDVIQRSPEHRTQISAHF